MHIRRFEASTLREALQHVKEELGPDALVLSQRSVRRDGGWFGWFGQPVVEIVAAVDREPLRGAETSPRVTPDPSWRSLSLTKALVDPLEAEVRALRRSLDALAVPQAQEGLRREVVELRQVVEDLQRPSAGCAQGAPDDLMSRLEAAGFALRHARSIAEEAAERARAEGQTDSDPRLALSQVLATRLDACMLPPREDDPNRISVLVGATGVGKTTTLAKLAARQPADADRVALLTTDTYRVAADEQLRVFAQRLGVRFEVAVSTEDLTRRVERLGRCRVLIDTAGRSRGDSSAIPDLVRCRAALGPRARVHLVMAAITHDTTLRAELERFAPLEPDALIMTKLDEGESLAHVANLLLDERTPPLTWLGTGQRVPDDLEVPDPSQLAVRMLGVAG